MYAKRRHLIGLAVLLWAGQATAGILPTTNDLWDVSKGSVVTGTSGVNTPFSDIRDMFGGTFSQSEAGDTVFANNEPAGFVHYVEWQTAAPVTIGAFNLFASGDGPQAQFPTQREFAQFVLKAKSSPSATNFDLTLYTLVVTNHPYVFVDPSNSCLISTTITPVTAQYFRAEFTQFTLGRGFDGPRILELDGFSPLGASLALYPGVTVTGTPGQAYGIQYSTNLSVTNGWVGLTNLTLTGTNELWYDSQPASLPHRYYRAVPGQVSIP